MRIRAVGAQSLEAAGVHEGQRVLIHAGAGGVGSFGVQLAKAQGRPRHHHSWAAQTSTLSSRYWPESGLSLEGSRLAWKRHNVLSA